MPGRARKGGSGLQGALDNDIYQAVAHLLHDTKKMPDVPALYQAIQRSNSSLKRKPKRVLEDSLDRILDTVRADMMEQDEEAAMDQQTKKDQAMEDANIMNRSITGSWNITTPVTAPDTSTSTELVKRREADGQPLKKRSKTKQTEDVDRSPPTATQLEDLGGVDGVKRQLMNLLTLPLLRPQLYTSCNIPIPRGVLLHGPPGCGKSMLARATAAKLGVPFIEILGPSVVSGMSGESEKQIRDRFDEAIKLAPCLIFIDEIDVIAPKRESSQSQMEKRIVAQLLLSIDSLALESSQSNGKPVIVLAATNRPDTIDPALRRGGRFDTEINMGVPNEPMREAILRTQMRNTPVADDVDFPRLAKMTPGYVGADLRDLVGKAAIWTMQKYQDALIQQTLKLETGMDIDEEQSQLGVDQVWDCLVKRAKDTDMPEPPGFEKVVLSMEAFVTVIPDIIPSSKREGFATIPDTTWEDIGALTNVREELHSAIVEPIKFPDMYAQVGISAPTGVLLWGPPGCGKTLLAKAVANESKANFISVKGPELLNKYVGESERAVRTLFNRARSSAPCVIFFDELDALVPRRDDSLSEASARVVNTLLTELDGLSTRTGIYVIAATNRPDIIDEAMLRPGRLETRIYVGLPGVDERVEILKALIMARSKGNKGGVWPAGIEEIVRDEKCDGYSGADIESLLRQAGQHALRRRDNKILTEDFQYAINTVKKSVGSIEKYERLKKKFASGF
ncbi:P-loop containing nucleoside triphosphate hydrolase protein [Delphinella strobiligena]|nr:P-loop containing nucleoside triphosphate hydrolase protein [Delphinella strobiligena]